MKGSTAASRGLAQVLVSTLPAEWSIRALRSVLSAHPDWRPATSLAHHLTAILSGHRRFVTATLEDGCRIRLDLREHRHRYMMVRGVWEEGTTRLLRRRARPGWSFADIGADAGYYGLVARQLGGPLARVVAFEPIPGSAALIDESIRENGFAPGFEVAVAACGACTGTAALALSPEVGNSGLATLVPNARADGARRIEVSVVRLDEECRRREFRPDVVKIDVEGYELDVLAGMSSLLDERVPELVICEVGNEPHRPPPQAVIAAFAARGYRAFRIGPQGGLRALDTEDATEENLAFAPPT